MTTEHLEQAGRLLLGDEWKRPLAKLLGPYHPMGARESLDPRLPFRWASGERPIPAWVPVAMAALLEIRAKELLRQSDEALAVSDVLTDLRTMDHDDPYYRKLYAALKGSLPDDR